MINIKNKEPEECAVLLVDMNGRICYQSYIEPNANLDIDLNSLMAGIYTLIFSTETTKLVQQIVKYW